MKVKKGGLQPWQEKAILAGIWLAKRDKSDDIVFKRSFNERAMSCDRIARNSWASKKVYCIICQRELIRQQSIARKTCIQCNAISKRGSK